MPSNNFIGQVAFWNRSWLSSLKGGFLSEVYISLYELVVEKSYIVTRNGILKMALYYLEHFTIRQLCNTHCYMTLFPTRIGHFVCYVLLSTTKSISRYWFIYVGFHTQLLYWLLLWTLTFIHVWIRFDIWTGHLTHVWQSNVQMYTQCRINKYFNSKRCRYNEKGQT